MEFDKFYSSSVGILRILKFMLISFQKPIGWSFFNLQDYLESQLGKKVDLVTPNALKELIKQNVLDEAHYL